MHTLSRVGERVGSQRASPLPTGPLTASGGSEVTSDRQRAQKVHVILGCAWWVRPDDALSVWTPMR